MRQERIPPPDLPLPDSNGFYTFSTIPLGMVQGWYYLPYRLDPSQLALARGISFMAATTVVLLIFFFLVTRSVPWTPAKYFIANILLIDFIQCVFNASWILGTPSVLGYHYGTYYACQVSGYFSAAWGAHGQSSMFCFMLERYLVIVRRVDISRSQARFVSGAVWVGALFIGGLPFMLGRKASVNPSGLYCTPPWSTGGTWEGIILGILGVGFISLNVFGIAIMYHRIYATFVQTSRTVEKAMEGGEDQSTAKNGQIPATPNNTTTSESKYSPTKTFMSQVQQARKGANVQYRKDSDEIAFRLARQALSYIIAYLSCMLPIYICIGHHLFSQMPPPAWLERLAYVMVHAYTLANPMLLLCLNPPYRSAMRGTLGEWRDTLRSWVGK
ncbi:hypothetical protein SpCBS45565_g07423 [Spizellomyces sp. 'palustris']|nr:hypothetical protein SpCBS45565_g07423 [Spizellomyces sp. 'palustris']